MPHSKSSLHSASLKSPAFQELIRLQSNQSPLAHEAERFRRKTADHSADSPEIQQSWFRSMKNVLQEIDEAIPCIPPEEYMSTFRFLDLGCCPGGFTSYVLSKHGEATGVGISLDVDKGGHEYLLEDDLRHRFELKWADLTHYALGVHPYLSHLDPSYLPFPFPGGSEGFDLVFLDGHPLRGTSHSEDQLSDHHANGDRIFISQLILGLWTLVQGGTLVVKLTLAQSDHTAQLLYMLDILAKDLRTWKPVCMHATQSTFYAVARGVGLGIGGVRHAEILYGLRNLWDNLTYGDDGMGRRMEADDLEFVISRADMRQKGFKIRRAELTEHILQVQALSKKGWMEYEGYERSP